MRAATYDAYARDNATLTCGEVPDPKVGPGQVLIEVRAAGVNPVDWKVMAGGLDGMMDAVFPVIPGWDVAGVVSACGPDTPEFAPGDEVMAYARKDSVHAGTFAQYVSVAAPAVARRPVTLSWEEAGGLPLTGLTALRTLDRLDVTAGDTLLVLGASGGVGSIALQLARERGVRVLGTASPRNHDYVRHLGGEPLTYEGDVAAAVRDLVPGGVDAVADFAGGQLQVALAALAPGGRLASIADPGVERHGGHWVWVRPDGGKLDELGALAERGVLTVTVSSAFPLEEVGAAFDASRTGHTRGKLVIVP
ncbi:NADP-dependent oxidoreductase [Nonomuraea sp. NBC_01738]|uniref:NADP-dependent oxidoreductase n=1 Tax=Nonomuraea sp. NBC_01738 TaxID=2976003 RepID=UPI002E121B20|nr:NADP-dependent oxidoreductase [Nonomuraea sp. NBC_01738]